MTLLDKDGVRLVIDDAVATVTLTNPAKRNAQSPATWRALTEAGRLLPGSVRVVVVRGEGKSFSAGLDRQAFTPEGFDGEPSFLDLARGTDAELDAAIATYQEAFTWLRRNDIVSVAAVQGHAIGAGFQLALACDLRVCADDAQFAMRETSLGSSPTWPVRTRWSPSWVRAGAGDLRHRPVRARRRGRARRSGQPGRPGRSTRRCGPGPGRRAAGAAPDAVVETKALLAGAAGRTYDEQRAAERAAQARRLRDLTGAGE
ncbi:enoyl-CoA hydratase/isomerase family protein [Streptomyces sp. M19]